MAYERDERMGEYIVVTSYSPVKNNDFSGDTFIWVSSEKYNNDELNDIFCGKVCQEEKLNYKELPQELKEALQNGLEIAIDEESYAWIKGIIVQRFGSVNKYKITFTEIVKKKICENLINSRSNSFKQ